MPLRPSTIGLRTLGKDVHKLAAALPFESGGPGVTDHGLLDGLADDDHANYVHLDNPKIITGQNSFTPGTPQAPFLLGTNARDITVIGFQADKLNKSVSTSGLGLSGGGALTANQTITLTSNSAPTDAQILASNANGYLQLVRLGIGVTPSFPLHIEEATTNQFVIAYDGTNYANINVASDGKLWMKSTGTGGGSIELQDDVTVSALLGVGIAPTSALHVRSITTPQFKLEYDATYISSMSISGAGTLSITATNNVLLDPTGYVEFNPAGKDILPSTNYDLNIGAINKKYLTLHAAELWVETLVAQDTLATIGGRILVGPTTILTSDLTDVATTIYVKHNQMTSGDTVYLEANGAVEFISIDSAPSGVGPYTYTVTRNLDGSGGNAWSAGDAMFNTGTTGDGFIDLYSVAGVDAASTAGPTIVGNVRKSTTYNDWIEHWAIGNLDGLYGYTVDTYGVGLGEYGVDHIVIDSTNGIRFRDASDNVQAQLTGSVWTLGDTAGGEYVSISSGGVDLYGGGLKVVSLSTSGDVTLGQVALNQGNVHWNSTDKVLEFRGGVGGTTITMHIDTNGDLVTGPPGGTNWAKITTDGLSIDVPSAVADDRGLLFRYSTFANIFARATGWYNIAGPYWGLILDASGFTPKAGVGQSWIELGKLDGDGNQIKLHTNRIRAYGGFNIDVGLVVGDTTTTPSDNNLVVIGDTWIGSGLAVGDIFASAPGTGDIYATGSIHSTTALACVVYKFEQVIAANGVWNNISFSTEEHDSNTMWAVGDPTKLYATEAGYYHIIAWIGWGNGVEYTQARILHQGTTQIGFQYRDRVATGYENYVISTLDYFTAGQFVTIGCRQGHTSTRLCTVRASMHKVP